LFSKRSDTTVPKGNKWTNEEDSTLKDAVKKHNGKNWGAITALVLGRTKIQCCARWHDNLRSKSDETIARKGPWTKEEVDILADACSKKSQWPKLGGNCRTGAGSIGTTV
jgi:hypothetical protein